MNTSGKKVIFTADDFGLSEGANLAILDSIKNGALTSACVCANGDFFNHAMGEILPQIPQMDLGVHLNIIEGKGMLPHRFLTNSNGEFYRGFVSLLINSYNKKFMKEVEAEFRAQIEAVFKEAKKVGVCVNFINSHVHTHAIPHIFELTAKLAAEYKIPFIRTQGERFYFAATPPKPINLLKVVVLNYFTIINRAVVKKYNLQTNDFILGVSYTGEMNENTVLEGLKGLLGFEGVVVEVLAHPSVEDKNSLKYAEYLMAASPEFKVEVEKLGFGVSGGY